MVDVSIIILNYNTFHLTCACIDSIYHQTVGVTYEIILVDNGSTECPLKLFKEKFPDIILIESETNLGFAKGNNLGLHYSTGKSILLLNSDTELLNNAIFLAYKCLIKKQKVAAITGKIVYPHGEPQQVAQKFPSIPLLLSEIFRIYKFIPKSRWGKIYAAHYFDYEEEIYPDWIWATFFLIVRDSIELFPEGKFPEDFFMYVEDKLWCYHLKSLGYKVMYSPKPQIMHHVAASTKNAENFYSKMTHILTNEFLFTRKTKGIIYAKTFFALQALHYRMSQYSLAPQMSEIYWSIAVKSPQEELPYFTRR